MNECDYFRHLEEIADDDLPNFDIDLTPLEIEEAEVLSAIQSYMESQCKDCSFVKGSPQCENCYVGGY